MFPTRLSLALLAATLNPFGCHAQLAPQAVVSAAITPPVIGKPLAPALARRIEVLLRQKANLPPGSSITITPVAAADLPGYSTVSVSFTNQGNSSRPIKFLISNDGRTLAQFTQFDLTSNPRNLISAAGRPARGGPETAPVVIVGFDDLECPFCAKLHETVFPAVTKRYGDQVRIVYKDFPLTEIHPWAMRAAVDVNCLGAQSTPGYWNLIDYVHAHAGEIGLDPKDAKAEKTLVRANEQLDKLAREQGEFQKLDMAKLNGCLTKQDTATVAAMRQEATTLALESTPVLFINGDKIDGAVPVEFIFGIIDDALRAEGVAPPPPYVAPAPALPATPALAPAPAAAAPAGPPKK